MDLGIAPATYRPIDVGQDPVGFEEVEGRPQLSFCIGRKAFPPCREEFDEVGVVEAQVFLVTVKLEEQEFVEVGGKRALVVEGPPQVVVEGAAVEGIEVVQGPYSRRIWL
jgi:hypothetical protein